MIEQLAQLEPSSSRSERTRARCHKQLERLRPPTVRKHYRLERAVVFGFGAIYLSSMAAAMVLILTSR